MSRFARHSRVFFFEEPVYEGNAAQLRRTDCAKTGVCVLTPVLPKGTKPDQAVSMQKFMLDGLCREQQVQNFTAWYYTPMALSFTSGLEPALTVYDCMDELSAFAGAPPAMRRNEQILFSRADLVFTGGRSLYESKQIRHPSVHLFPSSVDVSHFSKALTYRGEAPDQRSIPRPRIGFIGVIDERMDLDLLAHVAQSRPHWQLVMVGPVVKIDSASLPRHANIHYLGLKTYDELPGYLAGWDAAMLPFALNDSTRFISPTKTPEYLAAGRPVVSTPIRDVVYPYGDLGLAKIGKSGEEFVQAIDSILTSGMGASWRPSVTAFLDNLSWDKTFRAMSSLMDRKRAVAAAMAKAGTAALAISAGRVS